MSDSKGTPNGSHQESSTDRWAIFVLPLLIGMGSAAAFYRYNISQSTAADLLLPLGVAVVVAVLIGLVHRALPIERHRAAVSAALWAILFFSFGHLVNLFGTPTSEVPVHGQLESFLFAGLVGGYATLFVARLKGDLWPVVKGMLAFGTVLTAINLYPIASYLLFSSPDADVTNDQTTLSADQHTDRIDKALLSDIYLIILDEFASVSVIDELFEYDASAVSTRLEECGFVVQDDAKALSDNTVEVVASILNGRLITTPDFNLLFSRIKDNSVARVLKEAGYAIHYYPAYHYYSRLTPMEQADLNADPYKIAGVRSAIDTFSYEYLRTTAVRPFVTFVFRDRFGGSVNAVYTRHIIEALDELPRNPDPTFVYAHITCPHPPYSFDEYGNGFGFTSYDAERYYLGQYKYIARTISELACKIVQQSPVPPVVIVQSDHGVRGKKHASVGSEPHHWQSIFRAYHMPRSLSGESVPDLQPTDDFRYVIESILGRTLPRSTD